MSENNNIIAPKGSDVKDALREFQKHSLSSGSWPAQVSSGTHDAPLMVRLIIKLSGGALSQKQAEYFLIGFVVLALITFLFLFFKGTVSSKKFVLPPEFLNSAQQ